MRKTIYFAAIFVALAFVFTGCGKKTAEETGQLQNESNESATVEEFQSTIEEMAKSGKPYRCTYAMTYQDIYQEGTLYFAGEDSIRGDIKVNMPEVGEKMTHFVKDGETQYVWTDDQPTGIKVTMTKEEEEKLKEEAGEASQDSIDMDMKIDLKCKKWSPEKSVMTPPSNVQFQSLDDMMNAATGAGSMPGASAGGYGSSLNADDIDMCLICEKMPTGAARDSCMQANCE